MGNFKTINLFLTVLKAGKTVVGIQADPDWHRLVCFID